jgi:hypothetical protein
MRSRFVRIRPRGAVLRRSDPDPYVNPLHLGDGADGLLVGLGGLSGVITELLGFG